MNKNMEVYSSYDDDNIDYNAVIAFVIMSVVTTICIIIV